MARGILLGVALVVSACSSGPAPKEMFSALPGPGNGPQVELHYLGNGGWIFRRGTDTIATAPFVSNPNILTVLFPGEPNEKLIREVIPSMNDVRMILVGHAHYDHAMDLPAVHRQKAPNATIYGSRTVVNTLWAVEGLRPYLEGIDYEKAARGDVPGEWKRVEGSKIRVMPLRSTHAPHFLGIKFVPWGTVDEPQEKLPCCPYWWKEGQTYAFIIDFLDEKDEVEFRIYYQDAATDPGTGVAPVFEPQQAARVDVAILCVAAFDQVAGNPEHILTNLQPRSVIGGHWEDFLFQPYGAPPRAVPATSLANFHRRAQALAPERAIYLPNPGDKLHIPIAPRP